MVHSLLQKLNMAGPYMAYLQRPIVKKKSTMSEMGLAYFICILFFKINQRPIFMYLADNCPFVGPLVPLFWISSDVF